jgi:hypothetical protein
MSEIGCFGPEGLWPSKDQVMTFETFSTNIYVFADSLALEECLYVLQVLLHGNENILKKFGKVYIDG